MKTKRFYGTEKGSNCLIMYGVHGNEHAGAESVRRVISILEKEGVRSGVVTFLLGNPKAMLEDKRLIDLNLNRMFTKERLGQVNQKVPYEQARARKIAPELLLHDALLDLHSTDEATEPFFITENNLGPFFADAPASIKNVLFNVDAFHQGSTDYFMHVNDKVGICLECGQHIDNTAASVGETAILSFLASMGNIPWFVEKPPAGFQRTYCFAEHIHRTLTDFKLAGVFPEFTPLKAGDLIGYDGDADVRAPNDCLILFTNPCEQPGEEAFMLARPL